MWKKLKLWWASLFGGESKSEIPVETHGLPAHWIERIDTVQQPVKDSQQYGGLAVRAPDYRRIQPSVPTAKSEGNPAADILTTLLVVDAVTSHSRASEPTVVQEVLEPVQKVEIVPDTPVRRQESAYNTPPSEAVVSYPSDRYTPSDSDYSSFSSSSSSSSSDSFSGSSSWD